MKKAIVHLEAMKLIGISCRTNNATELQGSGKIFPLVQKYHTTIAPKIISQTSAAYSVYTEYASDYNGDYTYFIGAQVASIDNIPEGCSSLIIPQQKYAKFTTEYGQFPAICIAAWHEIWRMQNIELGGARNYLSDFEVYDERAADLNNAALDIYIGIH